MASPADDRRQRARRRHRQPNRRQRQFDRTARRDRTHPTRTPRRCHRPPQRATITARRHRIPPRATRRAPRAPDRHRRHPPAVYQTRPSIPATPHSRSRTHPRRALHRHHRTASTPARLMVPASGWRFGDLKTSLLVSVRTSTLVSWWSTPHRALLPAAGQASGSVDEGDGGCRADAHEHGRGGEGSAPLGEHFDDTRRVIGTRCHHQPADRHHSDASRFSRCRPSGSVPTNRGYRRARPASWSTVVTGASSRSLPLGTCSVSRPVDYRWLGTWMVHGIRSTAGRSRGRRDGPADARCAANLFLIAHSYTWTENRADRRLYG